MFNHLRSFAVAAAAACWVAAMMPAIGQTSAKGQTPPSPYVPVDPKTYQLKPDDVIDVSTLNVSEASGQFTIRRDGYITLPMGIGDVYVVGLTPLQCADLLAKKLKSQVLNPQVTVILKTQSSNRFYMMGGVKEQGIFDCKPRWRITEALAAAGGLTSPAERSRIVLWRAGQNHITIDLKDLLIKANDADNLEIQPGDVLNVQSDVSVRVQVVGQVKRPGIIEVLDGQGVAEVLSASGGVDPAARLTKVKLVRNGKEIPLDLYDIVVKGHPEHNMPVQENDTLYVPQNLDRVAVYGAVGKPGPMLLEDGRVTTLTDAISLAGGFGTGAVRSGVTLARKGPDGKWVNTNYDVQEMLKVNNKKDKNGNAVQSKVGAKPFDDPVLQDEDIIYVAESGKSSRDWSSVLGAFSLVRYFIP